MMGKVMCVDVVDTRCGEDVREHQDEGNALVRLLDSANFAQTPRRRALVLVDAVSGEVVEHLVEDNVEEVGEDA